MVLAAANLGSKRVRIGKQFFFVLLQFPYPVLNSLLGNRRHREELKSRAGISAVADSRQRFDRRSVGQWQRDHNRFAHPRRATDQRRHSSHTDIEAHTASNERSEAQEALERDRDAGNIARFPPADVILAGTGPRPPAVYIHVALLRQPYDGKPPPQPHPACRLARITPSNSSLSAGFWKKATAPDSSVRFSLPSGSRAVRTITGMTESAGCSCKLFSTANPSPAGSPRSRMIRWGCSF